MLAMQTVPADVPRRFVASLDVLGFTAALRTQGALRLANAYGTAIQISRRVQEAEHFVPSNPGVVTIGKPQEGQGILLFPNIERVAIFSDSIFIFTTNEDRESLIQLCEFCYFVFREFLRQGLPLRGAISQGEAIVYPDHNLYVGQAIVDAWKLEQSLDIVGIVLQPGLECVATAEAIVTYKCGHRERLRVPIHRDPLVTGEDQIANFQRARLQAGQDLARRYENSEEVVAAMMKIDRHLLARGT